MIQFRESQCSTWINLICKVYGFYLRLYIRTIIPALILFANHCDYYSEKDNITPKR